MQNSIKMMQDSICDILWENRPSISFDDKKIFPHGNNACIDKASVTLYNYR